DTVLTINCDIIVYFGVNIPQLCYDIQSKVKRDIENKTDYTVKAVNIRVEGLDKKETN
ncbi:MAG: Asp23/Gls24 family envelope stress response protein, partial [Mogibacterium sp.]|nr:Asp23/Gls24 family envelope stress response protein [Mogibacterium sp.]